MKKVLFLFWIAACWYLAGMYRSFPLMIAAVAGILVFLAASLLPYFLKRQLVLSFPQALATVERGETIRADLQIHNRGRLPVGRFRLRFRCESVFYRADKKKCKRWGSVGSGESVRVQTEFPAPFCGMVLLSLERGYVYDFLSLFRTRIRQKPKMEIAVLPLQRKMLFSFAADTNPESLGYEQTAPQLAGSDRNEIRQIRAYTPGDTYRTIHWNQSARTDTLLVKEYSREEDRRIRLSVDLTSPKKISVPAENAFYELLYALLLGLLADHLCPVVVWQSTEGKQSCELTSENDCRTWLARLYRESAQQDTLPQDAMEGLRFGRDLCLWYKGKPVVSFTVENYEAELEQSIRLG